MLFVAWLSILALIGFSVKAQTTVVTMNINWWVMTCTGASAIWLSSFTGSFGVWSSSWSSAANAYNCTDMKWTQRTTNYNLKLTKTLTNMSNNTLVIPTWNVTLTTDGWNLMQWTCSSSIAALNSVVFSNTTWADILSKTPNQAICQIWTKGTVLVSIPANQAVGAYSWEITITYAVN